MPGSGNSGGSESAGGFCNTVFNGGASTMSGWPGKTWGSLSSHGVDDWSQYPSLSYSQALD